MTRKAHKSDEYFSAKLKLPMGREAFTVVTEARSIRHKYPDLSGSEMGMLSAIRLTVSPTCSVQLLVAASPTRT